jgi:putative ABC transport system substrate-binding protein
VVARAQQPELPVVGFVNAGSADASAGFVAAFRKGLGETGYVKGQNVTVEYHWLEGQFDRLPALMADLVRRRVAVIATPTDTLASITAKAATATIPIVFGVGQDPVETGLAASLSRPGGNATGVNFFARELVAKRLALVHELVPKAASVSVLFNPANDSSAFVLREVQEAARVIGLRIDVLNASTSSEIDAAFASLARDRADALFIAPDSFFTSRRVQITTLAARERIAAFYSNRDYVAAGGLMSYGTDLADRFRQVGVYTGKILNGAKPTDLPVLQPTKFEFVINLKTSTIPIVIIFNDDPVQYGLVDSLSRPGGNITGVTSMQNELTGKQLNLLHEMVPAAKTVAFLSGTPNFLTYRAQTRSVREAGQALNLDVLIVECRDDRDFESAFETMVQRRIGALMVGPFPIRNLDKTVALAARFNIPTMYAGPGFVAGGGLMSYSAKPRANHRLVGAQYVARILKGAKPADLPVQQSTAFELVINLKTAKALGLTVPETLLATADEVIQ